MDDLRTILDNLKDKRLDYVLARSKVNSDNAALKEAGISHSAFFLWDKSERDYLNETAQRLRREVAVRALMILQESAEEAARVKVSGLRSRNEHIKQNVATEILDRNIGKAKQEVDVMSGGDRIVVKLVADENG